MNFCDDKEYGYHYENKVFQFRHLIKIKEYGEYETQQVSTITIDRYKFKGYVIFFVEEGQGIIKFHQKIIPLIKGNILIFNNDEKIVISNGLWKVKYIVIDTDHLKTMMKDIIGNRNLFYVSDFKEVKYIFNVFSRNRDESIKNVLENCQYLMELFLLLLNSQNYGDDKENFILKAMDYIDTHYDKDIDVTSLADMCGYSQYHFIREFKKILNVTPYRYIISRKLFYAKKMLKESDLDVYQIAMTVGFKSLSNFCKVFKKYEGITPKKYRKMVNNHERSI